MTKVSHGPACIIARSTETNNIVGIRTGQIESKAYRDGRGRKCLRILRRKLQDSSWLAKLPKCFRVSPLIVFFANMSKLCKDIHYDEELMFEQCGNVEMVYHCWVLSVGVEAQGKGLGTELIKRGYKLAKKVNSVLGNGHEYS